jgi:flagellar hook-basal body complex protein FliE
MSIPAIGAVGFTPLVAPSMPAASTGATSAADAAGATSATAGTDFAKLLSNGLENLQGLHTQTDQLAVKAATGDRKAVHDDTTTVTGA